MKPLSNRQEHMLREAMNRFIAKIIERQARKLEGARYAGANRFSQRSEDAA